MSEYELDSDDEYIVGLEAAAEVPPEVKSECCNCLSELEDVIYVECAECDAVICLPCFRMGAEMGDHIRGHAYQIVDGLSKHKLKGQWSHPDEVSLIEAAHTAKLGNWNALTDDQEETSKKRSREELSEYFDREFIRGAIGQFALNEGFWMKDRHKYKKQGTLKRLLDDKKHTNPLVYNLYLSAMRWKKCTRWKPGDPRLEEKIRKAAHEYMNYDFNIEGRELLGCLRDDYFFGGDLFFPEPLVVNPEFERQERKEEARRKRREREEVEDMLETDRIWRAQRDRALKRQSIQSDTATSSSASPEAVEMSSINCNGQSTSNHISSRRSSRSNQLEVEDMRKYIHPPTAPSISPTPLKIILKKIGKGDGRAEGYIVAKTTVAMDDSPFRTRTNGRRLLSQDSIDSPEDSDEEVPRQLNGHHKINGYHNSDDHFTDEHDESSQDCDSKGGYDSTHDSDFVTPVGSLCGNESDSIYVTPEKGDFENMDADSTFVQEEQLDDYIQERTFEKQSSEEPEEVEEEPEDLSPAKIKLNGNVIRTRKQRRKKKAIKSKKLRRLEAFHKRETTKSRKREKEFEKHADMITIDDVVNLRRESPYLALFRNGENPRPDRPKYRHDDVVMLTHNPERNEFEVESFNDAETMISELQLGPVTGLHPMVDLEQETKLARIYRYKRALQVRSARKTAITEHDKITEFIDFMKAMTLERRKCSDVLKDRTEEEKMLARSQQTLSREEFGHFQSRWEKFTDLKEKILKLQELQRNGETSLKGVDLVPSRKKREKKKNSDALKKAEARFKALQRLHIKMYAPED